MSLVGKLKDLSHWQADAIPRTYIEKRGTIELRGLGIPTMSDRTCQALVKLALEHKLNAIGPIARLVRGWLTAGILDGDKYLFPEAGVPQGGVISPWLCNVALHGFEESMISVSNRYRIAVIRYTDDLVMLCQAWIRYSKSNNELKLGWPR